MNILTYSVRPKFKIRAFLKTKIWFTETEKHNGVDPYYFFVFAEIFPSAPAQRDALRSYVRK